MFPKHPSTQYCHRIDNFLSLKYKNATFMIESRKVSPFHHLPLLACTALLGIFVYNYPSVPIYNLFDFFVPSLTVSSYSIFL
jgi:hypothetical protein